ncbi:MAG TPA: hypothetical protein PLC06_04620, partial [Promineifilum sp.]|nr:hypothetical protein [Promineifilum sp.]
MNNSQIKRMWVIALVIAGAGLVIVGRLFAFQLTQGEEFKKVLIKELPVTDQPERGVIYDRNGAILAVDRWDYRVAVSPSVLTDP